MNEVTPPLALCTAPNFHHPGHSPLQAYAPGDEFYEQLIAAHQGLSDEESRLLNARLVLLLANHIGNLDVIAQALAQARPR
jgi:hypothetical protein